MLIVIFFFYYHTMIHIATEERQYMKQWKHTTRKVTVKHSLCQTVNAIIHHSLQTDSMLHLWPTVLTVVVHWRVTHTALFLAARLCHLFTTVIIIFSNVNTLRIFRNRITFISQVFTYIHGICLQFLLSLHLHNKAEQRVVNLCMCVLCTYNKLNCSSELWCVLLLLCLVVLAYNFL